MKKRLRHTVRAALHNAHRHHHTKRHWFSLGLVALAAVFLAREWFNGNPTGHHLAVAVLAEVVSRGVGGGGGGEEV